MTSLTESIKKGPVMIMTLKYETEFPKALENLMLSMGMQGEAIYKGFPMINEGEEYWWCDAPPFTKGRTSVCLCHSLDQ
jgi:hypothetical protein